MSMSLMCRRDLYSQDRVQHNRRVQNAVSDTRLMRRRRQFWLTSIRLIKWESKAPQTSEDILVKICSDHHLIITRQWKNLDQRQNLVRSAEANNRCLKLQREPREANWRLMKLAARKSYQNSKWMMTTPSPPQICWGQKRWSIRHRWTPVWIRIWVRRTRSRQRGSQLCRCRVLRRLRLENWARNLKLRVKLRSRRLCQWLRRKSKRHRKMCQVWPRVTRSKPSKMDFKILRHHETLQRSALSVRPRCKKQKQFFQKINYWINRKYQHQEQVKEEIN